MAVSVAKHAALVARCRRVGWDVEVGEGGQDWAYRINCPDGTRVQLHRSPSDRMWESAVMKQLNRAGFAEAEAEWKANDERERRERLAEDKRRNDKRVAKVVKQSMAVAFAAGPKAIFPPDYKWLSTPADTPETRMMVITPDIAAKMLAEMNLRNRPMKPSHVEYFVDIIRAGEWALTHQGGAVNTEGQVQDGQHRLAAIAEAGIDVPMQWTVGAPPENFAKIDQNAVRSARDVASMRGEANANVLVTAARMLMLIDAYGTEAHLKKGVKIPIDRVDRAVIQYGDELRKCVADAKRIRAEIKLNAPAIASALYLIRQRMPEGDPRVAKFVQDLEDGIAITDKSDPVWLLRRAVARANDTHLSGRKMMLSWEAAALVIKAWNYRMSGKKINTMLWRQGSEPFPAHPYLPPPIEESEDL